MLGDLDVIIEVDPAALPFGILVRLIRQGGQTAPDDRAPRTVRGDFVPSCAKVDGSARQGACKLPR
jgi:hypothetical protein